MKPIFSVFFFWVLLGNIYGQQPTKIFRNPKDTTTNFYELWVPKGKIKGLLALDFQSLLPSTQILAGQEGVLLMNVTPTANYLDVMLEDKPLVLWDEMIQEVITKYQIPNDKVVVGGMSAGGVAAIRLAQYYVQHKLSDKVKIAGIVAVDPPLDYERFWKECKKKVSLNFHPAAVAEGKMLIKLFEDKLGGTPYQQLKAYQEASPFCYSAEKGGNAKWLTQLPIRIYHEPDVNWWIENRRQDYYGMNSVDCAALINQLKINGNNKASLISTENKGYRDDGSRHPHSWSIVDEKELLMWCSQLFDEK